ncbi:MAG TPA: RsmG family class I SAM-dependent methyltransferase [Polyangiaceae bacterium]|nr:RsmG family class I SAM-dependent methyltransferase [Polyangiaceae bacterium]
MLSTLGRDWLPRIDRVLQHFPAPRPVPEAACRELCNFLDLLVTWNQRMDLTAARSEDELVDLMLADAAMLVQGGIESGQHWMDIGTGAGAPGVALALLAPELRLTLVEPRQKRVSFLRTALSTLKRGDVRLERRRSEELATGACDVAVARATLPPPEWLAEGARLATKAVWVLLARDPAPERQGILADREVEYVWPLTGVPRRAVRYVQQS